MTDYTLGNRIRITASFVDADSAPTDPTTLTLYVKKHGAITEDTYVYGVDAEIVKDATGEYHAIIEPASAGWWLYRWVGEGAAVGATEGEFKMVQEYH